MRDCISDVCSSDLPLALPATAAPARARQRLATSAAPAGQEGADAFAVDLELDLQGPLRSGGGGGQEPAGAPHMDVRRFPRGQDAPSENPAGSANPVQGTGREGGVCFLCARFLCTSKERWLASSRRESF